MNSMNGADEKRKDDTGLGGDRKRESNVLC